jgi:hypothetical protein
MNAVKLDTAGRAGATSLQIAGSFGLWSGIQTLNISALSTGATQPNIGLPYAGAPKCSTIQNLTASGSVTGVFPFGSFKVYSPIRPLCAMVSVSKGSTTNLGDFILFPTQTDTVTANGWYDVRTDVRKPLGFSPIKFTGTSSKFGIVETAVEIATAATLRFSTPQVQYDYAVDIDGKKSVGALVYNPDDGSSWYLASETFNEDPLNPFRIGMTIPSSSLLIFGTLDNTINKELPATFSKTIYYIGDWDSKKFLFPSLNVSATGRNDFKMMISKSSPLSSTLEATISYFIGVSSATSKNSISISTAGTKGYSWAYIIMLIIVFINEILLLLVVLGFRSVLY